MTQRPFPRVGLALLVLSLTLAPGCGRSPPPAVTALEAWTPPLTHGEFRQAWQAALAAVKAAPERGDAWAGLARLCLAQGYMDEAQDVLAACQRLQPQEPRWPYFLALWHSGYGRLAEAEPLFARSVQLAPDHLPAALKYADTLVRLGRPVEAAGVYQRWLERHPGEVYALFGLGKLAFDEGAWDAAATRLDEARRADPSFGAALSLLATVQEKRGADAEAVLLRRQAASLGRYREPADVWQEELMSVCYDPYRLQVAASALGVQPGQGKADQWLARALALQPGDPRTLRQLGRLALARRDFNQAVTWLAQAVEQDPLHAPTYIDWIEALKNLKQRDEGARVIDLGLSRCPDAAGLNYEKAVLLIAQKRPDEALPYLEKTIALEPERFMAYQTLAAQQFRLGRFDDGHATLRKGLSHHPRHPALLLMLLRYQIEAGLAEEARGTYRDAEAAGVSEEALRDLGGFFTRRFGTRP